VEVPQAKYRDSGTEAGMTLCLSLLRMQESRCFFEIPASAGMTSGAEENSRGILPRMSGRMEELFLWSFFVRDLFLKEVFKRIQGNPVPGKQYCPISMSSASTVGS